MLGQRGIPMPSKKINLGKNGVISAHLFTGVFIPMDVKGRPKIVSILHSQKGRAIPFGSKSNETRIKEWVKLMLSDTKISEGQEYSRWILYGSVTANTGHNGFPYEIYRNPKDLWGAMPDDAEDYYPSLTLDLAERMLMSSVMETGILFGKLSHDATPLPSQFCVTGIGEYIQDLAENKNIQKPDDSKIRLSITAPSNEWISDCVYNDMPSNERREEPLECLKVKNTETGGVTEIML